MFYQLRLILFCFFCLLSLNLYAHADLQSLSGGFGSGFMHPLSGLDHVLAMVAVGLWGAFLGQPAFWLLPVSFPLMMTIGAVLGIANIPLPLVEIAIALSDLVLGLVIVLAFRPPLWIAVLIVGFFAIFHGYAHGIELPQAAQPLVYSLGFVMATGLLHLCGIALGEVKRLPKGIFFVRISGGMIMGFGLLLLFGLVQV